MLNDNDLNRYARQVIIPNFDEEGQEKTNYGSQHETGIQVRDQWIGEEVSKHPQIKNAGYDIRSVPVFPGRQLNGAWQTKERQHSHRKSRNKKGGNKDP